MTERTDNRIHIGSLAPGDVALLRDIAEVVADKAVAKAFIAMGLDPEAPLDAQRDFSALRRLAVKMEDPEFAADQQWARNRRLLEKGVVGKAIITAIGLSVIGAAHALWTGFKAIVLPNVQP